MKFDYYMNRKGLMFKPIIATEERRRELERMQNSTVIDSTTKNNEKIEMADENPYGEMISNPDKWKVETDEALKNFRFCKT